MILSVDPGTRCGWAQWGGAGLESWGHLADPDALDVWAFLADRAVEVGDVLVVEGQWYAAGKGANFRSVAALIESRCAWQDAAMIAGLEVEVVAPGRWIPAMTRGLPKEWTSKQRLQWVLEHRYPEIDCTEAERDAILLGRWWVEEHRCTGSLK